MDKNKILSIMPYILAVLILVLVGVIIFTDLNADKDAAGSLPTQAPTYIAEEPPQSMDITAVPEPAQEVQTTSAPEPVLEPTEAPVDTPVTEVPTQAPTEVPTPTEIADPSMGFKFEDKSDFVDTKDGVNLRSACSTSSPKITTLETGKRLERTGYNDEWTRVIYDGQECYLATYLVVRVVDSIDAEITPEPTPEPGEGEEVGQTAGTSGAGKIICIDAGHQSKGNSDTEPLGPGSGETKPKCSSGTSGAVGGDEYVLNLAVAKYLQAELEARGYTVVMTRTTNDVNLSNKDRATIANDAGADAFIRIHADSSTNTSAEGLYTICMQSDTPFNAGLYAKSRKLADCILEKATAATGAKARYVYESNDYSGINWSKVPVTIIEMGFMSNEKEDKLLADDTYRKKMAKGIADGIDAFFK